MFVDFYADSYSSIELAIPTHMLMAAKHTATSTLTPAVWAEGRVPCLVALRMGTPRSSSSATTEASTSTSIPRNTHPAEQDGGGELDGERGDSDEIEVGGKVVRSGELAGAELVEEVGGDCGEEQLAAQKGAEGEDETGDDEDRDGGGVRGVREKKGEDDVERDDADHGEVCERDRERRLDAGEEAGVEGAVVQRVGGVEGDEVGEGDEEGSPLPGRPVEHKVREQILNEHVHRPLQQRVPAHVLFVELVSDGEDELHQHHADAARRGVVVLVAERLGPDDLFSEQLREDNRERGGSREQRGLGVGVEGVVPERDLVGQLNHHYSIIHNYFGGGGG